MMDESATCQVAQFIIFFWYLEDTTPLLMILKMCSSPTHKYGSDMAR